ncbi:DUF397 domain-containing protein [Streptomyces sp. TS71-3]|uniref:DUF397 domain-containing protein n=1 Tax=Streptomyces sp. TS71-3 TaxID=2733862 RepID=UPI001B0CCC33|nr:DUF397 domain-containing protein [Streptomyces sp. TS71-3]GHJ37747.1 DUF397 domain-containing protein [Streptomyces sp. TS71-3]
MIRMTAAGGSPELAWFKSSYSGGNDGTSCVEVATSPGAVHVRDSKNIEGPRLTLTPRTWGRFVTYASES